MYFKQAPCSITKDKTYCARAAAIVRFLLNIAGSETPQIGENVHYKPDLWKVISEISPGVYRVESCLSRTRKVSTLELPAPANIRSRDLQTEVELQNQCAQL